MGRGREQGGVGGYVNLMWLTVLGLLWGSSYLFIKVAVAEVPPLTLVAARLALGSLVLWAVLLVTGQQMPRRWQLWKAYAVMGLLSGMVPFSLISWGEQQISSGLASLLQATMPIFTVILAQFLAKDEPLTAAKGLGVILGFVGVGILMLPDLKQGEHASALGQLAVVVASISYAGAALFARNHLRGEPPLISSAGQLTMGALYAVPLSLLIDHPIHVTPSLPTLASWLGLTLLGTVVAYQIYYTLIARTSATFVSTVTYIIPVGGLILGALVLREPVTLTLIGGLGVILLGVLLVRR